MENNRFRILGIKCLPIKNLNGEALFIAEHMQKSMIGNNEWTFLYGGISEKSGHIHIDNSIYSDEFLFNCNNLSVGISAIVGKNGCGKSTLLDMMIRILNNVSAAVIGEKLLYAAAEHLHYINYVYGAILYIQANQLYELNVQGYEVCIKEYPILEQNETFIMYGKSKIKAKILHSSSVSSDNLLPINVHQFQNLSNIFYTIVCNYSLYAYCYDDYWTEQTDENKLKKLGRRYADKNDPQDSIWLTGLFHKNDGYQTPIVINPMRNHGMINSPKENRLAKERIMSLLFYQSKNNEYPFRTINGNIHITGLSLVYSTDIKTKWTREWCVSRGLFSRSSNLFSNYNFICQIIEKYFIDFYAIDKKSNDYCYSLKYLVYKVIKISIVYRRYNKILNNLRRKSIDVSLLIDYLNELMKDDSHVTSKLRRVVLFLIYRAEVYPIDDCEDHRKRRYDLSFIDATIEHARDSFNKIPPPFMARKDDFLPPPIFDVQFCMTKDGCNNEIPFEGISSGERQIAYSISNVAYHLLNVDSVWKSNTNKIGKLPMLKYHYVNVIFDEIELYYHPDLQRRFLNLLLSMLQSIRLENIKGINIMLVTHSPYVLSDIPRSNVLALGDNVTQKETFCANIHEMLGNSFFMSYSIGELAQNALEDIFKTYIRYRHEINKEQLLNSIDFKKYQYIVSKVSDEYLRKTAQRMVDEMVQYTTNTSID